MKLQIIRDDKSLTTATVENISDIPSLLVAAANTWGGGTYTALVAGDHEATDEHRAYRDSEPMYRLTGE